MNIKIKDALNTIKERKHKQAQLRRREADLKRNAYKTEWARRKRQDNELDGLNDKIF